MSAAAAIAFGLFVVGVAGGLAQLWLQIWSVDTFTKLAIANGALIVVALAWHFVAAERRANERLSRDKRLD
jgi:uncharacterized membrane-anchored protein